MDASQPQVFHAFRNVLCLLEFARLNNDFLRTVSRYTQTPVVLFEMLRMEASTKIEYLAQIFIVAVTTWELFVTCVLCRL